VRRRAESLDSRRILDMRLVGIVVLAAALLGSTGCWNFRESTTPRTAVEQALLSQAAERTISQFDFGELRGKSFAIDASDFEASDAPYVLGSLKQQLLESGLKEAAAEEADLLVYPRVANAAIDDSSFSLGLPDLPLVIPNVGAVRIPNASLFRWSTQKGRNRMAVYAVDAKTGQLALGSETVSTETTYRRIGILTVFLFTLTDLSEPF